MGHRLAPGVKYGGDADLGAQPFGIGGDRLQRLGRDPHQQRIDDRLVVEGDLGDARWECEDHMKVWDRQEIGDAGRNPLPAGRALALRAVAIAAGIIGDAGPAAVIAGIDVTTKPGCAAGFDRAHDASFAAAKMAGVLSPVGASMSSKDVGDFEGRAQPITIPAVSPPAVTDRAG